MKTKPLVSVVMITYGHEHFIREAMEGVLMQKCNFDVELILSNDCSPDRTNKIIEELLENHPNASWVKYFNHATNVGMMHNFHFALQQAKGTYIALCDGDDYWTDAAKLEKQVQFLSNNDSMAACFHNVSVISNEKSTLYFQDKQEGAVTAEEIVLNGGGVYPTASLLFRNEISLPDFTLQSKAGDSALAFSLLEKGHFYFMNDTMAAYRKHAGGVFSSIKNDQSKRLEDIKSNLNLLVNYRKIAVNTPKEYFTQAISKQLDQFSNHFGTSKLWELKRTTALTTKDIVLFLTKKIKDKFK
ncbi:glycosyltransferase family 2 protein [Flavobacterium sp.]|jgi:glycosyltransferase involved in cell wall biosynthesis|uniref:glycosyltransferase family 2 protein n=1 Tax=Flavobacterium sp. TaxID=239 RepID=UPI0037BFCDCF